MAVTLCLFVGTIFLVLFFYNQYFYKPPVIPNAIKATVINCEMSKSRVAENLRKDNSGIELYDITYSFQDKEGNTIETVETVRYREDVGTVKDMIIVRKTSGHKELQEIEIQKPRSIWFCFVMFIVMYLLTFFFFITDMYPMFLLNLKYYGLQIIASMIFFAVSVFAFEKRRAYLDLINNPKQVNKFEAEIFKNNEYKVGKKTKYSPVYIYEENGVQKQYELERMFKRA